jgi:Excalibur calcium-binding domain
MRSVTSEGSPHGRFQRAVAAGLLLQADAAARELGRLSLPDALAFVALLAEHDDRRFARAAARWRARLEDEAGPLGLGDAHLVTAALFALQTDAARPALLTVLVVLERYRVPNAEKTFRPLLMRWSSSRPHSRHAAGTSF